MSVRLNDRTEIIEFYAVVLLHTFNHIGKENSKIVIAFRLEVERATTASVGSKPILSEINWRRIEESQEVFHSALFGQPQKTTLSLLLVPIVRAVGITETFCTRSRTYLAGIALLHASCTYVETPQAQADALWLSVGIILSAEQPIGHQPLLFLRPKSKPQHAPSIRSTEIIHCLTLFGSINLVYSIIVGHAQ